MKYRLKIQTNEKGDKTFEPQVKPFFLANWSALFPTYDSSEVENRTITSVRISKFKYICDSEEQAVEIVDFHKKLLSEKVKQHKSTTYKEL